jgi:hypothetical protein
VPLRASVEPTKDFEVSVVYRDDPLEALRHGGLENRYGQLPTSLALDRKTESSFGPVFRNVPRVRR